MRPLISVGSIFLTILPVILSSAGDSSPEFHKCTRQCRKTCAPSSIPAYLQYLYWDCPSECDYECMHWLSRQLKEEYDTVWKFYGHWPYVRLLGLQEPAAAIFSVGNMIPHMLNIYNNRIVYSKPGTPLGKHLVAYSIVALLAWTASSVFHTRKIDPFISFDYGFAYLFICYGLWISFTRLWWEFRGDRISSIKRTIDVGFSTHVFLQFLGILNGTVHFQDHMKLSIGLSICHSLLWLIFCCFSRSPTKLFCLLCQAWFGAASLLELFDFPPYLGVFDAHALWHAATIPLGFLWFQFWVRDSNYCSECFSAKSRSDLTIKSPPSRWHHAMDN